MVASSRVTGDTSVGACSSAANRVMSAQVDMTSAAGEPSRLVAVHAQRDEDRLVQVLGERHPRRRGHRLAQQLEAAVRVDPAHPGLRLDLALLNDTPEVCAARCRIVEPSGPAGSSQSTAPSSTAISTA